MAWVRNPLAQALHTSHLSQPPWPAPQTFLQLHYRLPGGYFGAIHAAATRRATDCAFAGSLLCCTFNALVSVALGWRKDCNCAGKPAEGSNAAQQGPGVTASIAAVKVQEKVQAAGQEV